MNGRLVIAVGMFLTGLLLGGWLIFLAGEGLDRADQWSSVVGAVAAVLLGLGGVVLSGLSWREARRANERSGSEPTDVTPGIPDAAGTTPAEPIQLNLASGGATVFGVQGGNLYLGESPAPPAPEGGR